MRTPRVTVIVLTAALLLGACGDDDPAPTASPSPTGLIEGGEADEQVNVHNASFDLAVGEDQRVLIGLTTSDAELVAFGEVDVQLFFLGENDASGSPEERGTATASWLSVPGMEPDASSDRPTILTSGGSGVYETELTFDAPGFYGLLVTTELADGRTVAGGGSVQVRTEPQVPAVGDDAPSVRQATLGEDSFDFTLAEIDSRAINDGTVPDPELHDRAIEDILEAGEPMVVVVSTPVFCQSRFCGPITDTVEQLQAEYGDRAEFVHLEVWEDYEESKLNASAAKWIATPDGGNEPWTFFVGADGKIQARWGNVLDEAELREILEGLPVLGADESGDGADAETADGDG